MILLLLVLLGLKLLAVLALLGLKRFLKYFLLTCLILMEYTIVKYIILVNTVGWPHSIFHPPEIVIVMLIYGGKEDANEK